MKWDSKCVPSFNEAEALRLICLEILVCDYQSGNDPFKSVAGLFVGEPGAGHVQGGGRFQSTTSEPDRV